MSRRPAPFDLLELSLEDGLCCVACRDGFAPDDRLIVCPACRATHHRECVTKAGGCTTFGCANGAWVPPLPRSRRGVVLAAVGALLLSAGGLAAWSALTSAEPPGCVLPRSPVVREGPRLVRQPVELPPPPVCELPPPPPQPLAPDVQLRVPTTASSNEILIRGHISGDGPLRVDVRAPSGHVGWDAVESGPFVTGVTLTGPGRHEIEVTVTDARRRSTTTTYVVHRQG